MGAVSNIVRQGDAAYNELARGIMAEDSAFEKLYDRFRGELPATVRDQMPARASKLELRRSIARISNFLGPVGARALVPAVEYAVEDADPITSLELIRTLYWSIPESARAVRILSNYVAKPSPQKLLFGSTRASETWSHVPRLAPLMAPWLKFPDQAGEAAEALGAMGNVSAFAVEDIAQVANFGVAGNPPVFQPRMSYPPGDDPRSRNRCRAIGALGLIGTTNAVVFETLKNSIIDADQIVRCYAADAVGALGSKAVPVLPFLLEHLDTSNRLVLRYQIEAIGKMGPDAAAAVPALLKYSEPAAVNAVPEPGFPNRMIRVNSEPIHLPYGAAFAVGQINTEEARKRLDVLARSLSFRIPAESVVKLLPLKDDLLRVSEPLLKESGSRGFFIGQLAANLLVIDPGFKPARMALEKQLSSQTEPERSISALNFFRATGDTNRVLELFGNALASAGERTQITVQMLGELGPVAKPLVPKIKPYLESENFGMRMAAGRALRSISPESLPPVRETD